MNEPPDSPQPYRVSYSGRVLEAALVDHHTQNAGCGHGQELPNRQQIAPQVKSGGILALAPRLKGTARGMGVHRAIFEIDRLLRIYPQFGEPLCDLSTRQTTLWFATIPPLVVHYIVDEAKRQVIVVGPMQPLPNSGL